MRIEEIELKNTVNMMISDDYQERFKAEFWQTLIRYRKLSFQLAGWDTAPFIHQSDRKTLERQAELLAGLLYIYMKRAVLERVDLFVGDFRSAEKLHINGNGVGPMFSSAEDDPIEQLRKLSEEWANKQPEILRYTGYPVKDSISQAEEEILGSSDIGRGIHA